MGYNYKEIDKRRQEAPFLILEKNIYQQLNVGSIAEVIDIYNKDGKYGVKLKLIPKGNFIDCTEILDSLFTNDTLNLVKGDKVVVIFLDNYGTQELTDKTSVIMHDYRNSVIIGKLH